MTKAQNIQYFLLRAWLLLLVSVFVLGCLDVGRDSGATREEALEIEAYAVAAQGLEPARKHLLSTWSKLAEAPTFELFGTTLRARVLPAVEAYLTTLEGCEVNHQRIHKVHGALVESYGRFVRDLRALSSKTATATPSEVEEGLRQLLVGARQAQAMYQQDMSTLYARSGYKLETEGAEPEEQSSHKN